jgi:hypothetical protein
LAMIFDQTGRFDLVVEAPGHRSYHQVVEVPADDCGGPIPITLTIRLDPSP